MSDFDEVFLKKNDEIDTVEPIPQIILQYLNKDMPKGLEYKDIGDGRAVIYPTDSVDVSGIKFVVPAKLKKIIKYENRKLSFQLVQDYSYNAQIKIKLELLDGENILLNHEKIRTIDMVKSIYRPELQIKEGNFYAIPQPFGDPFLVPIGYEGYEKQVLVKRVPNPDSIYIAKFQSVNKECLHIIYYVDQEKHNLKLTLNIDIKRAKTVQEIIESIKIFYAFIHKKGMLCKQPSGYENIYYNGDKFNLAIWEHAKAIEDKLNISFCIPSKGIKNDELERIEELYQLLVLGVPLRDKQNYATFSVNLSKKNDMDIKRGTELFLTFTQEVKEKVLSAKIHYYTVNGVYNAEMNNIEAVTTGYKVTLTPVKNKKMYIAKKAFIAEELIDDEKIKSQLMNEIRLAKNIYEIIQEQFSKGIENE